MKKVFLDCGSHDGCSVRKFLDVMEDSSEYEIHSFEPNPNLAKYHPVTPAIFHKYAVWVEYGEITFYNFSTTGGSSVLKEKHERNVRKTSQKPAWMQNFGLPEAITVNAIDFSSWVSSNFDKNDYIIVKMDIEGAEYEILKKMLVENTIDYINEFWVEWHFTNQQKYYNIANQFAKLITQRGIKLVDWDAMHAPYLLETNCSESPEFGKK